MGNFIGISILFWAATTTMGQQISKLKPEDVVSVRGVLFGLVPCGASTPNPEQLLEKETEHVADMNRLKLLGYLCHC